MTTIKALAQRRASYLRLPYGLRLNICHAFQCGLCFVAHVNVANAQKNVFLHLLCVDVLCRVMRDVKKIRRLVRQNKPCSDAVTRALIENKLCQHYTHQTPLF